MSARLFLPLALLLTAGCAKKSDPAPKELGELGAFLFAHFDDDDTLVTQDANGADVDGLQGGLLNLRDFLMNDVDYSLDAKENAVVMPILKGDDLGTLTQPAGVDPEDQDNIALPGKSAFDLDSALIPILEKNQICIESSSTIWAERTFLTDTACFEDRSCDFLEVKGEVRKENILAKVWFDQYKTYRWVQVEEEDGSVTEMLIARSWIEKLYPADGGGGNSWDQLYQLDVSIPNPDKPGETLRWFSMWSSITLGGLSDDAYSNLVRDGIEEGYIYGDEFIAGNIETCKNDRAEPKPDK